MHSTLSSLDPLASYLEPQFGNIYELGSWTPELRVAITGYLVSEMGDADYASFLGELVDEVPHVSRHDQIEFIVKHHDF